MNAYSIRRASPQFRVADIERAIRFYTEKLGFDLSFRFEDFYAGINKDGCSIHLKTSEVRRDRAPDDLDLVFSVPEIEAVYELLLSRNVEIRQPLRTMEYGKEFYIADPDGNLLGFVGAD